MIQSAFLAALALSLLGAAPRADIEQTLKERRESLQRVHVRYVVKSQNEVQYDLLKVGEARRVVATIPETKLLVWKSFDGKTSYGTSWPQDGSRQQQVVKRSPGLALLVRNSLSPLHWTGLELQGLEESLIDWLPAAKPLGESKLGTWEVADFDLGIHARVHKRPMVDSKVKYGCRLSTAHAWAPAVITVHNQQEGSQEYTFEVTEFREIEHPVRKTKIPFPWKMKGFLTSGQMPPVVVETLSVDLDPRVPEGSFVPGSDAGTQFVDGDIN